MYRAYGKCVILGFRGLRFRALSQPGRMDDGRALQQ